MSNKERRTERVYIGCTKSELEQMQRSADRSFMTVQEYVRRCVGEGMIEDNKDPDNRQFAPLFDYLDLIYGEMRQLRQMNYDILARLASLKEGV